MFLLRPVDDSRRFVRRPRHPCETRRAVAVGALATACGLFPPLTANAQEATGTLAVVNKSIDAVSILDLSSGRLLARLPTGNNPHEVVLTSDGSTAVVTDYGDRTLTVIDLPSLSVARTIDLGRHQAPHGISVLPGDELVAVTSERSGHVVIVRIADGEIVAEIPTGHPGSHMLGVTRDGATIYTSNISDGTVSALDVANRSHAATFTVPAQPEAIGVSPEGQEVWVGSNGEGAVSVIHVASGEVEEALTGFQWPYRILFTDSGLVLIPDLRGDRLPIVDRASREERAVLDFPGGGPQGVTLSADGGTAFLSLSRQGVLAVIDLETFEVTREIETGQTPDGVAFTTRRLEGPAP